MKNKKFCFTILLSLLIFVSCTNKESNDATSKKNDNSVNLTKVEDLEKMPILKGVNISEKVFDYKPNQENNFEYGKNKTEITIPAEAFVDINGKKVTGNVKVTYKEIRTASDIIISSVDMKYDSAGVTHDFQTAGMFEINASLKDQEVYLDKGKEITVLYASQAEGDYNFYRYNKGNWSHKSASVEISEEEEKAENLKYNSLKPVKFNPNKDLVLEITVDYQQIEELKIYSDIIWKYAGEKPNTVILRLLQNGAKKQKLTKSNKKGKYNFSFSVGKKEHTLLVSPVFSGKALKKATNKYTTSINANQTTRNSENNNFVRRRSNVSRLGLHNYDRIYGRADAIFVNVDFKIKGEYNIQNFHVFHITGNDDVIVKQRAGKMYFSKIMTNKLLAILPDNNIAVLSSSDFKNLQSGISEKQKVTFELEKLDIIVESPDDLNEIITSL